MVRTCICEREVETSSKLDRCWLQSVCASYYTPVMIADSCNLMYIGKVLHGMGISRKCMQTLGLAYAWALQFQFKQSCMIGCDDGQQ